MRRNQIIYIVVGAVIIIILLYSFLGTGGQENYVQEVLKEREETNRFMRTSPESPFKFVEEDFQGLKYFDPDPGYKINADFIPISNGQIRRIPTSDGKEELYLEYGYADFRLQNRDLRLLVLQSTDQSKHLFIPFADSTSGDLTYGAGRYLDITFVRDGKILIDFNYAYNPYCAYSKKYSCPLPPAENYLAVSILAGEKNYD